MNDLFAGKARFEGIDESQPVTFVFKTPIPVVDQKLAFFDQKASDQVTVIKRYALTRGLVNGNFNIFVMEVDPTGLILTEVGPIFKFGPGENWSVYDPHIAYDAAANTFVMAMECVQFAEAPAWYSQFGASVCTSTSTTPWIPASWSQPALVVESLAHKSASTGGILIDKDGKRYMKWTIVDDGNDPGSSGQSVSVSAATYASTTFFPVACPQTTAPNTTCNQPSESLLPSIPSPGPAAISNLQVTLDTPPGPGNSITLTGRLSGSNTSLTCTITGAQNSCADSYFNGKHHFDIKTADNYYWMLTVNGTPAQTGITIGWTVTAPDEGTESASTWATQLSDYSKYMGYSPTAGKLLLGAEQNTNCNSAWDCNNIDVQDWQRVDGYYYAIYNGSNYYRCSRPPQSAGNLTNLWALGIRRSTSPLGTYDESTGPLISAERDDICGISYPTVKLPATTADETVLYYSYYTATNPMGNATKRARLVWAADNAPATIATPPATPAFQADFHPGDLVIRPNTALRFDGGYLGMQSDGNLVMYAGTPEMPGKVLWNTATAGTCPAPCAAVLQSDGNFVVYSGISRSQRVPAWDLLSKKQIQALTIQLRAGSEPSFLPYMEFAPSSFVLRSGASLQLPGMHLVMQEAGNLVMYKNAPFTGTPDVWSTPTTNLCFAHVAGEPAKCDLVFESNGSLVMYDDGFQYWRSDAGGANRTLRVQVGSPWVSIWDPTGMVWSQVP